jgi:hypothetical protein
LVYNKNKYENQLLKTIKHPSFSVVFLTLHLRF